MVNTTSLATARRCLALPEAALRRCRLKLVCDIVYAPLELCRRRDGHVGVDGLSMPLIKPRYHLKFWRGMRPQIDTALRDSYRFAGGLEY